MNALTKTVKRIAGALAPSNVEALRGQLITRQTELKSAQRSLDEARARRRAAIEADATDSEVDTIEVEIKAAENTLSRANERLQVAQERMEKAESEAKEAADRAAKDAHQRNLQKSAPGARQAAHDAAFGALSAIKTIAQLEIESMRLASAAHLERSGMAVESAARAIEGSGREQILDAEEVELWADRTGKALGTQPKTVNDEQVVLTAPIPAALRYPGCASKYTVTRWRFRHERFYPARGATYVVPFAEALRLPSLTPGGSPVWDKEHYHEDPADLLEEVEKAFGRLAAQMDELSGSKPALGKPSERFVPVAEIPFEVARKLANSLL